MPTVAVKNSARGAVEVAVSTESDICTVRIFVMSIGLDKGACDPVYDES